VRVALIVATAILLGCAASASGAGLHHFALHVVYWGAPPTGVRAAVTQLETGRATAAA
jgi:hypothetical protein